MTIKIESSLSSSSSSLANLEAPIEAAHLDGLLIEMDGERVLVDHVDHGAHDRGRVARYPVQQRLQPTFLFSSFTRRSSLFIKFPAIPASIEIISCFEFDFPAF